ncbi:MAG: hypothetical protein EOM30_10160 [Clostridia bacterium]|jgi:uncharacterized membrane protein|nr:hypothetical protein [Clostridia bacterium]NLS86294.1 putative ABC transporter permease [Oscillospiraceae bacterium]
MENLFFEHAYGISDAINAFFMYSFFGWAMECLYIRATEGFWENRGFVHAPFCIIYGFGGMLGYVLLKPFSDNYINLYIAGAILATVFELLTAHLMRRLFGTVWWDYNEKFLNYKGVICLESTLGWGVISVLLFAVLQRGIFSIVMRIPRETAPVIAGFLVLAYSIDFAVSVHTAYMRKQRNENNETSASDILKG